MLDKLKLALRIVTDTFDDELNDIIAAAKLDLGLAGVSNDDLILSTEPKDELIIRAIITYARFNFGEISEKKFSQYKAIYDEQKAQLTTATGYTDWEEDEIDE